MRDLQGEARRLIEVHDLQQQLGEAELLAIDLYDALLSTGRRLSPVVEEQLERLRRKHQGAPTK